MYFPQEAPTPAQPRWAMDREAYRGYQNSNSSTKPDLIAIKLSPGPGQLGQMPQFTSRDFLWIECKAACQDKRFGWKDVLGEAAGRLRTVFLMYLRGRHLLHSIVSARARVLFRTAPKCYFGPARVSRRIHARSKDEIIPRPPEGSARRQPVCIG